MYQMLSIQSSVFDEHHLFIENCLRERETADPFMKKLIESYLYNLASKSGNDTLEKVLVEATGRRVKQTAQKHGADSEDGELEAKPLKGVYSAHISDDTPSSLIKHQVIPYIIICRASPDGRKIMWALLCSYRIFDDARFKALVQQLPESEKKRFQTLPTQPAERYKVLTSLMRASGKKNGIRSNPLPFSCISALQPGEYSVWVNPTVNSGDIEKDIIRLHTAQVDICHTQLQFTNNIKECIQKEICQDLSTKSVKELKEICKKKKIKGYSNKSREKLIEMLNASENRMSPLQTAESPSPL